MIIGRSSVFSYKFGRILYGLPSKQHNVSDFGFVFRDFLQKKIILCFFIFSLLLYGDVFMRFFAEAVQLS